MRSQNDTEDQAVVQCSPDARQYVHMQESVLFSPFPSYTVSYTWKMRLFSQRIIWLLPGHINQFKYFNAKFM